MLKNYWRIGWRFLQRNKIFTAIHVLGLSLGICGCLVLFLITHYEFSFDRNWADGERIYRIVGERHSPDGNEGFMNSPNDDVAGFETQIPGFESKAALYEHHGKIAVLKTGGKAKEFDNHIPNTWQATAAFTRPGYFDVFRYSWLEGTARSLDQPDNVVLTESRARLYFGDIPLGEMMGKTVVYDDSIQMHVAGVVKDPAGNTDFGYTDFLSLTTATHSFLKNRIPTADWTSLSPHQSMAFVKLARGVTPEQVNRRFASYIKAHVHLRRPGTSLVFYLQPLRALHFTPDFHRGDDGDNWRKPYLPTLYSMIGVAVFILLIAVVNFINLSTAQSMSRAKEVGVRKVMGSRKSNIRIQFLIETLMVTLLAMVAGVLLVNPVLGLFHDYVPSGVEFHLFNPAMFGFLVAVTVLTTLLAGSYPAVVLSNYLAVLSLKGMVAGSGRGGGGLNIRRALIVFQFTISLLFIVGAIVIGKQISYMRNADKGFNTDRVMTLSEWDLTPSKLETFAKSLRQLPGVESVVMEGTPPMGFAQNMDMFSATPDPKSLRGVSAHMGNEDYIPFYGMKLVAGRNIFHSDSLRELIINETYARQLGCKTPQEALGRILYGATQGGGVNKGFPVAGVVADFHVGSFHEAIPPTVIENVKDRMQSVAIKVASSDPAAVKRVMTGMEEEWKKQFPDRPFRASPLNESIGWLYGQEENTAWLVKMAMGVTVFISCMGLFGLGLFTTRRRAKEISIRKVLGASVASITTLLTKDFAWLVAIAFLVATPVAWWFSHQWLQDFVYRTTLSWWVFLLAGLGALGIALLTVGLQAISAATANPVKYLKNE
jgi:putative ABC transport system permease protein